MQVCPFVVRDAPRHVADTATEQISGQEREQRANHKQILDDLLSIRDRAEKVWRKIGERAAPNLWTASSYVCLLDVKARARK